MDEVSILIIIAPLLLSCWSERQYFPQSTNASWAMARKHCQVCYKDLVTVSYDNSFVLVQGATGQQWIGLRENFNGTDEPWSAWANGDPIIFQNWYPVKPPDPVVEPSTTIAAPTTVAAPTVDTNHQTTKGLTETSSSGFPENSSSSFTETASAFTITAFPETSSFTQTYYDDTTSLTTRQNVRKYCVAMHHFGPWVEEDCAKRLPYICYDDRFYGNASVVVGATNATLSWQEAPGNISSYRVEVQGDVPLNESVVGLTYNLLNMTPGTEYKVRVFAVKCDRELNSQNISFITRPETPYNLTVVNTTERSAFLRWERPVGNLGYYCVMVDVEPCQNTTEEEAEVRNLTPGKEYTVHVLSVTGDVEGERASITLYTRPSVVTNLIIFDTTNRSLVLRWTHDGPAEGYRVVATNDTSHELYDKTVTFPTKNATVGDVPPGTHLWLTVRTQAHGLEGKAASIDSFIDPDPVPNLILTALDSTITASWDPPVGSYQSFDVSVQLSYSSKDPAHRTTNATSLTLEGLYAAAQYTVTVTTLAGERESKPTVNTTFTKPVMAEDLKVTCEDDTSKCTLTWKTPNTAPTTKYRVEYNASFWGHRGVSNLTGTSPSKISLTVASLKRGTRYLFQVITLSGTMQSDPAQCQHVTPGDMIDVTLSMMCSSAKQSCENEYTKNAVLEKLKGRFGDVLDGVSWEIKWKKTAQ